MIVYTENIINPKIQYWKALCKCNSIPLVGNMVTKFENIIKEAQYHVPNAKFQIEYTWRSIADTVKLYGVNTLFLDIDGVIISEANNYTTTTEEELIKLLNSLKNEGIKIIVVTSRHEGKNGSNRIKTENVLQSFGLKYDLLIMTNHDEEGKGPYLLKYINQNPQCKAIFVDNFPENLWSAAYACKNVSNNLKHFILYIGDSVRGYYIIK